MTNSRGFLPTPLARIGLIIPSSNRLTEPQLRHFAPLELGIHVDPPADDRQME